MNSHTDGCYISDTQVGLGDNSISIRDGDKILIDDDDQLGSVSLIGGHMG